MDEKFFQEWQKTFDSEKCDGVDMETGLRDCWNFICMKNHIWRYKELHNQPERSKREDSVVVVNDNKFDHAFKACSTEMRCSEHCGNTVRTK